jgi:hypothetical protein
MNTIERKDTIDETKLGYVIQDVRKRLAQEKITPEMPNYEKLLNTTIRLVLLKEKHGILKPGQPSQERQEWFDYINAALESENNKTASTRRWEITSAQRQQLREEKRAGQTYAESDLE